MAVREEFLGRTPTGVKFARLVSLVQEILPGQIDYDVLEDSLRHVAGTEIDARLLDDFCWRMAGNTRRLKQFRPVPPWHVQKLPEWVPVQIVSARRARNDRNDMGALMGFKVLAGTPCPRVVHKWWSLKMARYVSTDLGFTRQRGKEPSRFPYSYPEQLVSLRHYVLIDPDECDKEPGFSQLAYSESMKEWNRDTVVARFRADADFHCQMGKSAEELPCDRCPIGFEKCRAGTHRHDWVQKECTHCEKKDAWFDPEIVGNKCVECFVRDVYKRDSSNG